ncbi:Gfo/Idh/MocA family protein [Clostridium sp. AUH-JLR23]|uniref:Gfo/Idh/MocA family protein n=1 Tax=Clostridium sp. AUH-JLR23 TaxID=1505062 RepID=UPI00356511BD
MIKIGILGAADIAYRMFLPALMENKNFQCVGLAEEYDQSKVEKFQNEFHIDIYDCFDDLIDNPEIEVLYIPLPPALHYQYAKKALLKNKHVFLEKPLTTNYEDTLELIKIANERNLVLQENYMFQYHSQLSEIQNVLLNKELGDLRLIRSNFCFPKRQSNDFRYSKKLGGGALLDAGGYVVKLATILLGTNLHIECAHLYNSIEYDIDLFGDFSASNDNVTFQGAFGMDNDYSCSLEIIGSKGKLSTNRIFTSPPGNKPMLTITKNNQIEEFVLKEDNHFSKSINVFWNALRDENERKKLYDDLKIQSYLVNQIRDLGGNKND